MLKKFGIPALLAFAVSTSLAGAQTRQARGGVELGIDGGVAFGLDDPNYTLVSLPIQFFRVGFFVDNKIELEPQLSFGSFHGGGESGTAYDVELGVLFLPHGDRVGRGIYVRPYLGVAGSSTSDSGSDNSGFGGAGVGLKIPFADRRLGTRVEANYTHGFGSAVPNQIGLTIGLSFFTR